jgi:hypothetical protein
MSSKNDDNSRFALASVAVGVLDDVDLFPCGHAESSKNVKVYLNLEGIDFFDDARLTDISLMRLKDIDGKSSNCLKIRPKSIEWNNARSLYELYVTDLEIINTYETGLSIQSGAMIGRVECVACYDRI